MLLLTYITSALIILTKLLDAWTTVRGIRYPEQERNQLVSRWMKKYGINTTIFIVMLVVILIVSISQYRIVCCMHTIWVMVSYIIIGLFLSYANLAVAHSNYFQRHNAFTRWLSRQKNYRYP